jgi:lipoyl(octanoyl) transferase
MTKHPLIIRDFGILDYQATWENMQDFTDKRNSETPDELWLLEHTPVFTQGLAGKPEHILNPHHIPIVQTDRGGQVTYHGPGQLVAYALFDLSRHKLHARELVRKLEQSVIDVLNQYGVNAQARCDAPGVYIAAEKICSIGLRVRKNCSYHGIALNVNMDLTPFSYINPCGHQGMQMTQIKNFSNPVTVKEVKKLLISAIEINFGYNAQQQTNLEQ